MAQSPYLMMGRQQPGLDPFGQLGPELPPAFVPQVPAPIQAQPQLTMPQPTQAQLNAQASMPNPSNVPVQNDLIAAYAQSQAMQQEAIKNAEEQLAAARNKPQQMDLSPLIALAEKWSGNAPNTLLRAYKAPTDKQKNIEALQEAVLKARGGASELARMRAKDVRSLDLQERQMLINEELKRAQISGMNKQKEDKQDFSALKFRRESEDKYTKTYGEPLRNLTMFAGKVSQLEKKLKEKGDPFWGADAKEIDSLASSINTDYNRDIGKLGALAAQDLDLIVAATGQGISPQDYVKRMISGGVEGRIKLLQMLKSDAQKRADAYKSEVESNSDYEFVAKRLDNDINSFNRSLNVQNNSNEKKQWTKEELIQLQKTNPQEFEKVVGGK